MQFKDEMVCQEHRFALGTCTRPAKDAEPELAKRYLSIPTTNGTMDYEEYYELSEEQFKQFKKDVSKGAIFAADARRHELDGLLIIKPGRERGWAQ